MCMPRNPSQHLSTISFTNSMSPGGSICMSHLNGIFPLTWSTRSIVEYSPASSFGSSTGMLPRMRDT